MRVLLSLRKHLPLKVDSRKSKAAECCGFIIGVS